MHLECVFISEMDKNEIFVWWLIHHSQIECCVCQRSGMVCQRQNLCLCREKKQKILLQNSLKSSTSQFSCMIPWLIHTSTNRLLHQGAAFWLWDQCRQRDKVLLQVGRLIEEEIDSWWWSGGWCIIVIVAMLSDLLYPWQTKLTCLPFSSEHFCNTATKIENGPTKLLLILLQIGYFAMHIWDSDFISRFAMQGVRNTVSRNTRLHLPSSQLEKCHLMLSSVESIMVM